MLGSVVFAIIGLGLLFLGILIKFKKKINLIFSLKEEKIKKIKKVNKVAHDFGWAMIILAISCFITAATIYFFGRMGSIVGLIFIVIAAGNWSNVNSAFDEKIRNKIY